MLILKITMRNIFKAAGNLLPTLAILAIASSCTQDPILPIDTTKEEYTKNFIMEFGIPAEGHDFAMATTAGLKIKTATDAHVRVTAEIDGKEYLFADLNLPEGIHPLPVTIPRSVTTLKIKSGFNTYEAGVNDVVDIDADVPPSRTITISGSGASKLEITETSDEAPLLTFSPDEFLNEYLSKFQKETDTTDKWYLGKDIGDGYIDPSLDDESFAYFGETGLGATDPVDNKKGLEYLIFPVWWNKNRYYNKDYRLTLVQYNEANNKHNLSFNDTLPNKPHFPYLGYSESVISHEKAAEDFDAFTFDNGNFSQAYDPEKTKTVVTKGVRVITNPDPVDRSAFRFDLRSGTGTTYSYSSTVPYYNRKVWKEKYYDESLSDLIFATVSTMSYPLKERTFKISNFENNNINTTEYYIKYPFLVGFTSQPRCAADTEPRNYTDLILLVLPIKGLKVFYNIGEVLEPYIWTIAVEDLGATDDWDFNDAVFHFTDVITNLNEVNGNNAVTSRSGPLAAEMVRTIKVWPVATGGTMPIYITFTGKAAGMPSDVLSEWGTEMFSSANDKIKNIKNSATTGTFIVGKEIHKWLGASSYSQFVNVGKTRSDIEGEPVRLAIPEDSFGEEYNDDYVFASKDNKPLYGFSLLVDKDNSLEIDAFKNGTGIVPLPENLKLGEGTYLIGAPNEKGSIAPQMLLIADDAEWEWPAERKKISDAYRYFKQWIGNPAYHAWFCYPTDSLVTKK